MAGIITLHLFLFLVLLQVATSSWVTKLELAIAIYEKFSFSKCATFVRHKIYFTVQVSEDTEEFVGVEVEHDSL